MRMPAIARPVAFLAALVLPFPGAALARDWSVYIDERFGASAEGPASGFVPAGPPPGGEGRRWVSADGLAEIRIYGAFIGPGRSWDDYRTNMARDMIRGGVDLVHEAWNDDWFVLSGVKDERVRYTRAVRSTRCEPPVAVHVVLAYPLAQKGHYDRIVTRMAMTLKAGPGSVCGSK